jgi:phospholipid/cholesterol/gamma-HCH transport system ATP-binding protein
MMRSIKLEKIFPLHGAIRRRGRLRPSAEKYEPRNPDAERFPEIWSGSGEVHKKARDHGLKLVEMRNVSLRFGEKVIFDDLNLAVKRRERFVLMGPSGTGKSTLLKLIVATLRPDSGSIRLHNRDLTRVRPRRLNQFRSRIGMIYQNAALISSLNVRDNLALPLQELTRKTRNEIEVVVDEKLGFVGLPDTKELFPGELSGGMRKRIAVARALVMEPELVMFDEPTAGLDPIASAIIDELIVRLQAERDCTCIVVTHELQSAFRVATRVALLSRGKIVEEGTPEEFQSSRNPIVAPFLAGDARGPLGQST